MHFKDDQDTLRRILNTVEESGHIKDLDALLDRVLLDARHLTRADAGSIFLVENNVLNFRNIHNDTLFTTPSNKYIYSSHTLEINNQSLAGYAANTGESVVLDDVYQIPAHMPFSFNPSFDEASGYRTRSMLVVPLKTSRGKIVGVLQIINALNDQKKVITFTDRDRLVLNYFAVHAAAAIERAMMTREIILRMIKMCELRDPHETGAHANRVAAYAAEIYQQWALSKGIAPEEIKRMRDLIRVAAMLHDLGKIAISDLILKKPGKLDPEEYQIMKRHTIYGARLFENATSELDALGAEIALNHHERWDGQGYPGHLEDISAGNLTLGPGKRGQEIPLAGRIVALADIYDALVSKRAYKEPFPEAQALDLIRENSGQIFDPEVVAAFFAIYDIIGAIREKYAEAPSHSQFCWITP
ncbi:MAG: HD domain-containing protein [Deltaproteobacteria bacterium]|nr:HD domain-containing protein [Deltaproteobacteria bacterium]